jgi:hypothetical protein
MMASYKCLLESILNPSLRISEGVSRDLEDGHCLLATRTAELPFLPSEGMLLCNNFGVDVDGYESWTEFRVKVVRFDMDQGVFRVHGELAVGLPVDSPDELPDPVEAMKCFPGWKFEPWGEESDEKKAETSESAAD